MLILNRRRQESIRISDDIVVTVLAVRGKAARIGVEAPKRIHVVRGGLKKHVSETPHDAVLGWLSAVEQRTSA